MPSGAKKRKAAKKKQVSSTNPLQDDKTLDPLVEVVEKREDSSSENKSKEESSNEIEIRSKSKSSSSDSSDSSDDQDKVVEKKVVVESTPVIETPIDSISEEKKDLVTQKETETEAHVVEEKQKVVVDSEICLKNDLPTSSVAVETVLKENEETDYSEPKEEFAASSVAVNDSVSEVRGADFVNETETVEHSERQTHPAAPIPLAAQNTTSWKSCCGIFELFSGSGR